MRRAALMMPRRAIADAHAQRCFILPAHDDTAVQNTITSPIDIPT